MTGPELQAAAVCAALITISAGLIWLGHRLTTEGTR